MKYFHLRDMLQWSWWWDAGKGCFCKVLTLVLAKIMTLSRKRDAVSIHLWLCQVVVSLVLPNSKPLHRGNTWYLIIWKAAWWLQIKDISLAKSWCRNAGQFNIHIVGKWLRRRRQRAFHILMTCAELKVGGDPVWFIKEHQLVVYLAAAADDVI